MFVQLLFSCRLNVKESSMATSLTALWDGLSRGAKAQTLAGKPGRGPGPNHYSVLKGTTTQPAKVCGPGPAGSDQMTLDSRHVDMHCVFIYIYVRVCVCVCVCMYVCEWELTKGTEASQVTLIIYYASHKFTSQRGNVYSSPDEKVQYSTARRR